MSLLDAATSKPRQGGASFSWSHRALRVAWNIVWSVLGIWTPVPLHGWRRLLLRVFGARVDRTARVYPGVRIWYPPNLEMRAFACLGPGVDCYCMGPVVLESYALVSQRASLCGGTHDIDDPHFQLRVAPIRIGAHAWVAAEAFVGPGVSVGEGAVLGARGVAMRSLAPWTLYAGNPARQLRPRVRPPGELGHD